MEIRNKTPFLPFTFQSLDLDDDPFQVILVKGTFDLVPGEVLRRADEQEPVRVRDEPWRTDTPSSPRWEDDLAPLKPRSDIVIHATAHAPGRTPAAEWLVGVSVGSLSRQLRVVGPRVWARAPLLGWALEPPVPTLSVPLRYEHAFGGCVERGGRVVAHEHNPVGVGFVDEARLSDDRPIPAPMILPADGREPVLGRGFPVEGFAPIGRAWQPRRGRAGTYDDRWKAERHPRMPRDFDFAYYNCSHPSLTYDGYLGGDEEVRLVHLHPRYERLTFRLPALVVAVAITDGDGYRYGAPARLDTLAIDVEAMKVRLVWRAQLPLFKDGVRRIDVGMRASLAAAFARAAGRVPARGGS